MANTERQFQGPTLMAKADNQCQGLIPRADAESQHQDQIPRTDTKGMTSVEALCLDSFSAANQRRRLSGISMHMCI